MFARILVPLDGSTLATGVLTHVARLTRTHGEMILLRVLEQAADSPPSDPLEWRVRRDMARAYLDQVARRLDEEIGLKPKVLLEEGHPAERILAVARETDSDLIALSSHGAGGLTAWNISSVAFKVAQRSGVSVLIVRGYRRGSQGEDAPLAPETYHRILVPLDGSLRAEHVVPTADSLAAQLGATLLLAHVVQIPRFIQRKGGQLADLIERAVEEGVSEAQSYLEDIASGLQADTVVRVLKNHDPAAVLHRLATEEDVDLVVLSAHGHSGERNWPHANMATSFVLHGDTALLVLQDIPWNILEPSPAEISAASAPAPSHRSATGALPGQVTVV